MSRKIAIILLIILFLLALASCHYSKEGFESWYPRLSFFHLTNEEYFFEKELLTTYQYCNGNFFYDYSDPTLFSRCIERVFAFLTYDDSEIYQSAKQYCFDTRKTDLVSFDGTVAFGFVFNIYYDWSDLNDSNETQFPKWFTAFGFNDGTQTLVLLGFCCDLPQKEPYVELAKTDFSAFLTHYYGDWFDWEAGVGESSLTENPN